MTYNVFGGTLNLAQSTNRNKKNVNLTSLTAVCINTPPSSLAVAVVSPQSQASSGVERAFSTRRSVC